MPREQAMGEHVDRRADIFSVGVMLWEAVAGKRPWTGLDHSAILQRLVAGRFPSLREACPGVSAELEAIVHKALAPAREDRYATAADLQAAIEAHLDRCGDHTHPRDLGGLLARHFASERTAIRAIVQEQMRDGRDESPVRRAASPRAGTPPAGTPPTATPPAATPPIEERCTVPEPAVARSRSPGAHPDPGGIVPVDRGPRSSPPPFERPRLRVRRRPSIVSLALIVFAVVMAGVVRSLPARAPRVVAVASAAAATCAVPARRAP